MDEVRIKHLIKNYLRDHLRIETNVDVDTSEYGERAEHTIKVGVALMLDDEVLSIVSAEDKLNVYNQ